MSRLIGAFKPGYDPRRKINYAGRPPAPHSVRELLKWAGELKLTDADEAVIRKHFPSIPESEVLTVEKMAALKLYDAIFAGNLDAIKLWAERRDGKLREPESDGQSRSMLDDVSDEQVARMAAEYLDGNRPRRTEEPNQE